MSRRFRLFLGIIGGFVAFIAVVLLGVYLAARQVPEFYSTAMDIPPAKLEEASDRMLQQATALVGAVKQKGDWKALFTAEQINGWLAVDLKKNHPDTLPPTLRDPRVAIEPTQITLACRVEREGTGSVLSLTVQPYVPEPNVVALRIVKARVGLLPVPLQPVLDRFSQAARAMQLHLEWRRSQGDPVAMISLPANAEADQIMKVETLRLGDGEIYIAGSTQSSTAKKD